MFNNINNLENEINNFVTDVNNYIEKYGNIVDDVLLSISSNIHANDYLVFNDVDLQEHVKKIWSKMKTNEIVSLLSMKQNLNSKYNSLKYKFNIYKDKLLDLDAVSKCNYQKSNLDRAIEIEKKKQSNVHNSTLKKVKDNESIVSDYKQDEKKLLEEKKLFSAQIEDLNLFQELGVNKLLLFISFTISCATILLGMNLTSEFLVDNNYPSYYIVVYPILSLSFATAIYQIYKELNFNKKFSDIIFAMSLFVLGVFFYYFRDFGIDEINISKAISENKSNINIDDNSFKLVVSSIILEIFSLGKLLITLAPILSKKEMKIYTNKAKSSCLKLDKKLEQIQALKQNILNDNKILINKIKNQDYHAHKIKYLNMQKNKIDEKISKINNAVSNSIPKEQIDKLNAIDKNLISAIQKLRQHSLEETVSESIKKELQFMTAINRTYDNEEVYYA